MDYLNGSEMFNSDIQIECDIQYDEQLPDASVLEDVDTMSSELFRIVHVQKTENKIAWDSLTDEELALTVDKASDRELLRLFKDYGINMHVSANRSVTTFHDAIFLEIVNDLQDSQLESEITIMQYVSTVETLQRNNRMGIKNGVNLTGCYLAKVRYLSRALTRIAMYGNLTNGLSVQDEKYAKTYHEDPDGNYIDALMLKGFDISDTQLNRLYGRELTVEDREKLQEYNFCDASMQYNLMKSKFVGEKYSNTCPIFISDGKETPLSKFIQSFVKVNTDILTVSMLKTICIVLTNACSNIISSNDSRLFDRKHGLYLPRAVCFGINIGIIIESLIALIGNIVIGLQEMSDLGMNTNDDSQINVRSCIRSIMSLDAMYSSHAGMDKYRKLKMYEDIYSNFFDSIVRDY